MWKFLRGGATFIPGATSIPESRVNSLKISKLTETVYCLRLYGKLIICQLGTLHLAA